MACSLQFVPTMRAIHTIGILVTMAAGCDEPASATDHAGGTGAPHVRTSEQAERLASFKAHEESVPCPTFAAGSDVPYGDFVFRFETPILTTAETRLPWIANENERAALRGGHVLIVPFALENTSPLAKSPPEGILLATRDGKTHHSWPYNEKLWSRQQGRALVWELGELRPDEWVKTAYIYDVDPAELEGAVLYLHRVGSVRDARGDSHRILYEHRVADLAVAVEGEPIRGSRPATR